MDGLDVYERCDGVCDLTIGRCADRTAVADLYQSHPCRLLTPSAEPGEAFTAVLVTTSGGLAGGDRLRLSVTARPDTASVITSQAADKIYRSLGPETLIEVGISARSGAWLEWLPQGTILFDGARLVRRTNLQVAENARVLAGEIVVFGRTARGETVRSGLLHDAWAVRRNKGRLRWADRARLEGDIPALRAHPAGFGGAVASATVVYVADDADAWLATARQLIAEPEGRAGATVINGVLVIRFLSADTAGLYRDVARFWCGFRAACGGLPARLPRVWQA
jgi:urease accessory protein